MRISLIAAIADNGVIGWRGSLPWGRDSADLAHFRHTTYGKPVIMGRGTWDSLHRKPLPGRLNIVVSHSLPRAASRQPPRQPNDAPTGVVVINSLTRALSLALAEVRNREGAGEAEVMVIGGAEIYEQALPLASRMYLTRIPGTWPGDRTFPLFDLQRWQMVKNEPLPGSELICEVWESIPESKETTQ